jgi:hypothetical protein
MVSLGELQAQFPSWTLGPNTYFSLGASPSSIVKSLTVSASETEVIITAAGQMIVRFAHLAPSQNLPPDLVKVYLVRKMLPAGFDSPLNFECVLDATGAGNWHYAAPLYE